MGESPDFLRAHLEEVPLFRALLRSIECRLIRDSYPLSEPILDVGCGDGHFASLAFTSPPQVGFDIDRASLQQAQERGSLRLLLEAEASLQPLRSSTFGTVVANCSIEHMPELDGILQEIFRVLKEGGRFIFGVPGPRFGDFLLGTAILSRLGGPRLGERYARWFHRISKHLHVYSVETWKRLLEDKGLHLEQWQPYVSVGAHRIFDLCHYLSLPRWLSFKLTGRWVLFPGLFTNRFLERWFRGYLDQGDLTDGAYLFFRCRKL